MITSPLSKLVNSYEWYSEEGPDGTTSNFGGGFYIEADNTYRTLKTIPLTIQHSDSKLIFNLNASVYVYANSSVIFQIYLDDVLQATVTKTGPGTTEANYCYLFTQTIKNISEGNHKLTLKWRCNGGSTAAEVYYSRTNPAFVSFTAQEIRK